MDLGRFDVGGEELGLEYCLTFVRELSAAQVAERLGGVAVARVHGMKHEDGEFVLVADLPGGAVMIEVFGCRTVFEDISGPLSRGTTVAVVYESENNDPAFLWAEDGDVRVSFNPQSAGWREGSDPDALLADLRQLGFDLAEEPEYDEQAQLRAVALGERVTGLRMHAGMLRDLAYTALSPPESPPIKISDQHDTVSLSGVPGAAFGTPLIIEPYSYAGLDAALAYTVEGVWQQLSRTDDGSVRLFVRIKAAGVRGRLPAGPHDFVFVAADGAGFGSMVVSNISTRLLETVHVEAGEELSGEMLFIVPPGVVAGGRLAYVVDGVPLGWWALSE